MGDFPSAPCSARGLGRGVGLGAAASFSAPLQLGRCDGERGGAPIRLLPLASPLSTQQNTSWWEAGCLISILGQVLAPLAAPFVQWE